MKLIKEFKEFAVKGNMIEIAIGVIIGSAFNKVIDVLVKEIFMPPIGLISNGINLENKKIILREAITLDKTILVQEIAINYGKLIETGIDFLIVSLTVFFVIKLMNTIRKKSEDPKDKTVVTPKDIELLYKISTLLEEQLTVLNKQQKIK